MTRHRYGVFIMVNRKKDLTTLLEDLAHIDLDRTAKGDERLGVLTTPLQLTEHRVIAGEVEL